MNLILLAPDEVGPGGEIALNDRRAAHILQVLKPQVGQALTVGLINGPVGKGTVTAMHANGVVELVFVATGAARPPLPVHLVLAMPRPRVAARIVEAAAAFGVQSLTFINSWRVEKSYFDSPLVTEAALREALLRGAEQGKTTHVPRLASFMRFMTFVDAVDVATRWVCHPGGANTIASLVAAPAMPITLANPAMVLIGPEGAFVDRELATLAEAGFAQARLSAATLRCEQAVYAALAQFEMCLTGA